MILWRDSMDSWQGTARRMMGRQTAPVAASDSDELLKNADLALYQAKRQGRGMYRFFDAELNARAPASTVRCAAVSDKILVLACANTIVAKRPTD